MQNLLYLFGQLTDDDVDWMGAIGKRRPLDDGHVVIATGTYLDAVYVLLRGKLGVEVNGTEVTELEPGEIVGEMSLVDARPASASVVAREGTLVLEVNKDKLLARLNADTGFAARFYRGVAIALSDRIRQIQRRPDEDGSAGRKPVFDNERARRRFFRLRETSR